MEHTKETWDNATTTEVPRDVLLAYIEELRQQRDVADEGRNYANELLTKVTEERDEWKRIVDRLTDQRDALEDQRDELLAAINKFLSDNNPEGFGCACEPNRLCGPCSEAKRQAPLYAANPETIKQLVELCRLQHEALMLLDYGTRFDEATGAIAAFNKFEGGE